MSKKLEDYILTIPNFPKDGIMFRDVTTLMQDPVGFKLAIDSVCDILKDLDFDYVVGPESRGFIFGTPVAYKMEKGFIPVRKKGKLPRATVSEEYQLEYGSAIMEMHKDSLKSGDKVVIIDDLIATGGSLKCVIDLVEMLGGEVVKVISIIELKGLQARKKLEEYDVESLISYPGI